MKKITFLILVVASLAALANGRNFPKPGEQVSAGKYFVSCQPSAGECFHSEADVICENKDMRLLIEPRAKECRMDYRMPVGCFCLSKK